MEKENTGSLSNNQLNVKVESTKIVETQDEKSITQNSSIKKEASLREQLRKEIIEIYETSKDKDAISDIILQSDVYKILKEKIARKEVIKEDDNLWYNIEETILKCSPKFMDNLNLLAMGHLTRLELHTIFLIKCGLKPASEMPILLGRSQGTVVSRRQAICIKLFGETMNVKVLDAIIRQL